MTALIGVSKSWDESSRFTFGGEESWTTSFPIVDTFFGEVTDPQSLHKYLYTHGNPVNGIDPTGREFSAIGMTSVSSIGGFLNNLTGSAGMNVMEHLHQQKENQLAMGFSVAMAALPLGGKFAGWLFGKISSGAARLAKGLGFVRDKLTTIARWIGNAPPPSGPVSSGLRDKMLKAAEGKLFRARVEAWAAVTGKKVDWDAFMTKLQNADFREFASTSDAARSFGYAQKAANGEWLFGVAGYNIPIYGKSTIHHELFHAVQDLTTGLFSQPSTLKTWLTAEAAANFWGSPMIGVPVVYGGLTYILYKGEQLLEEGVGLVSDNIALGDED